MASSGSVISSSYPEFHAILVRVETVRQLNILLSPATALSTRSVGYLAGELEFSIDAITFIESKPYPFLYLMDQWIKRTEWQAETGKHKRATLNKLLEILTKMKRLDAAELVEKELQYLHDQDPKEVLKLEERLRQSLLSAKTTKRPSSSEVKTTSKKNNELWLQRDANSAQKYLHFVEKEEDKTNPKVYVVYCGDQKSHCDNVKRFVRKLVSLGINATCDMFDDMGSQSDQGFYITTSLMKADKVLIVCSELLYNGWTAALNKSADLESDEVKRVAFIMHIVLSEIYEASGKNPKYIPVVFNSKTCKIDHVPQLLKTYTIFTMERDLKKLQYRIWDKEMYKLAPLPKNPPRLKQIVIG